MQAQAGAILKGYELKERIGAGGFGAVYTADQSTIGRTVAIKIILPHYASQPEFIRRFETEAQVVARLEHPHIVPLYDYWRDPDGAYLVMRYLKGGSLREALKQGAFTLEVSARVLDQIALALSAAHRGGIVHRDLKPGNILLDEDGNAYLGDFGIAKDVTLQDGVTEPDAIIGSPDYLAPEQARSETVTARTDIYSLGVVLYEMLTGEHPFPNLNAVERLYKHLNEPLPEIVMLPADIRAAVNTVIQKATAKNPELRYADALEMASAFREAAHTSSTNVAETLTPREHEILALLIDGKSNKEIAAQLVVTVMTVKWYVTQIYRKLGVRTRVQAIIRARELHLISGDDAGHSRESDRDAVTIIPTEEFQPQNPYKGLNAFQTSDFQDFYGREKLVTRLVKRLAETNHDEGSNRFLAVVGPSGSGKSSLVKAGLIPALWRGDIPGSERWFVAEMLPGSHPLEELEVALTRLASSPISNMNEHLMRDERGLIRAAALILPNDGSELVLVVDQFEEVFTLVEDEAARAHFLNLIYTAVTSLRGRVRVIITLRADFYDRPLQYAEFGDLIRTHMDTILPLSAEELGRAVAKPAERAGARFEDGLVNTIIADVNYQPGALPLLQYALTELFDNRTGKLLTFAAYQAIGRTTGALAQRAEDIFADFDADGQQAARQLFLRLITLSEGAEDTRRRAERAELLAVSDPDLADEIIDTFAAYRLLALDHEPGTRKPTVELAHEAIIREWERLRGWLNEARHDIHLQRQLHSAEQEWREAGEEPSFLLRGSRLESLEKWTAQTDIALTPREREYLDVSLAQRAKEVRAENERQAREAALEKRSVRRLQALIGVLIIALIGAGILTAFALHQSQIAERIGAEAHTVALIAGSQAALAGGNTDQAIALALEAVRSDPMSARAQVTLSEAAYASGTIRVFDGHTAPVYGVAFSPDERTALSASDDSTLILWDVQTGELIRRFEGHTGSVSPVRFLPDGLTAISGSLDGSIIHWNLQNGEIIRQFEGQDGEIWALALSPDGQTVASAGSNGSIILWDIASGEQRGRLEPDSASTFSLEYSADGSQLLSSHDSIVILWNTADEEPIRRFNGNDGALYSAAFSPDETAILSGSSFGQMVLWDIESGEILHQFDNSGATITKVGFIPNSPYILSAGIAGLRLWNVNNTQPVEELFGHTGSVTAFVISADGRNILSASEDTSLRLWDRQYGQVIRSFDNNGLNWTGLDVSPDGTLMMTAWFDGTDTELVVWDVVSGEEIRRDGFENDYVNNIAFSPDGTSVLLATGMQGAVLWNVLEGGEIRRFSGHGAWVLAVAFSPDGSQAASTDTSGMIAVWDTESGETLWRSAVNAEFTTVTFSPDGRSLVGFDDVGAVVTEWDAETGAEIRQFEGHSGSVLSFVFSDDGTRAFSASTDNTAILWDTASGAIIRRFDSHSAPLALGDMTGDGSMGIAGSADGTASLWNLTSGEVLRRYYMAYNFFFSPDNQTVVASLPFNYIEMWRLDDTLDELLNWTLANRYIPGLTCDQREMYQIEPLCAGDGI